MPPILVRGGQRLLVPVTENCAHHTTLKTSHSTKDSTLYCILTTTMHTQNYLTDRILCIFHCIHYTAQCTLHTAHCTLHTAHCSLYPAQCILHTAHCTLHTVHCTLHTAHCTLHTALCTLHPAWRGSHASPCTSCAWNEVSSVSFHHVYLLI